MKLGQILRESEDDHWRSMPRDFLHAETNRVLSQHGYERIPGGDGKQHVYWRRHHTQPVGGESLNQDFAEIGWSHPEETFDNHHYSHPSGANLTIAKRPESFNGKHALAFYRAPL